MENHESIEQILDRMDLNTVKKQMKSPLFGILILLLGVLSIILNSIYHFDPRGFISPMLVMTSFSLSIWGVLAIIFRKKYYVSTISNQKLKVNELYFDTKEKDKLVRIMDTNDYSELQQLRKSTNDGLKLRYMATKDGQVCYSQVIAFIPNEFVRVTNVKQHYDNDSKKLVDTATLISKQNTK